MNHEGVTKNALGIAFGANIQYIGMKCATKAGLRVHVLGSRRASALRESRYCKGFTLGPGYSDFSSQKIQTEWLEKIEECIRREKIDLLIALDIEATELLARLAGQLSVPNLPINSLEALDLLNSKWNFGKLCEELGIRTPRSWRFDDKASLLEALERDDFPEKLILKPIAAEGGIGVIPFAKKHAGKTLEAVEYAPLLLQEFIEGSHIGLSVFTSHGKTIVSVVHQIVNQRFVFSQNQEYQQFGCRINEHVKASGIMNYDAQITPEGLIYLLECNPRGYFTMDYTALAGVNMIEVAMQDWSNFSGPPMTVADAAFTAPIGCLKRILRVKPTTRNDRRMLLEEIRDPVIFVKRTIARLRSRGTGWA